MKLKDHMITQEEESRAYQNQESVRQYIAEHPERYEPEFYGTIMSQEELNNMSQSLRG